MAIKRLNVASEDTLQGVKSDVADVKTDVAGVKVDVASVNSNIGGTADTGGLSPVLLLQPAHPGDRPGHLSERNRREEPPAARAKKAQGTTHRRRLSL